MTAVEEGQAVPADVGLPNGWTTVALGEVAGINPRAEARPSADEIVSFVPMAELDEDTASTSAGTLRPFREVSKGYKNFRRGDLLVARVTPCFENGKIGQARISRPLGAGSTEFHVLRPKLGFVDDRFLLHYLRLTRIREQGKQKMTGTGGLRRIPAGFFEKLPVPLPPLDEQRRIAAILDHADALRAKRREALAHLDALPQAIFHERFHGISRYAPLGDVVEEGPTNGLYRPVRDYGSGTPILRIDSFDNDGTVAREWPRVQVSEAERERYALSVGDIVLNRVNSLSHLGKSALIRELPEPSVFESNMMRFRVRSSVILPEFMAMFLRTRSARMQILRKAKKAVNQASVNQKDILGMRIVIPELKAQQDFEIYARSARKMGETMRKNLGVQDKLFASLQFRAFRGEL